MTEIEQAQQFIRAMLTVPDNVQKALVTLLEGPPEIVDAFVTVLKWTEPKGGE